ncbi:MAG: trypsin-like peptidase domain-containing protein [Bdellovibrionota bacterium]
MLKNCKKLLTFVALGSALIGNSVYAADPSQGLDPKEVALALSKAFGKAARTITPSVVTITISGKDQEKPQLATPASPTPTPAPGQLAPEDFHTLGSGTGIIIDDRGFIVTNNHVVEGGSQVSVQLSDKRTFSAEIAGKDVKSDLALLKVNAEDLEPAPLGNSDELIVGQWVVAAGNPFGLSNSITAGIISAHGRSLISGMPDLDFIQTDAAINPGNSGGPLINLSGEVIGINTAIFSRSGGYMGIGFAIPINRAKTVIETLKSAYTKEHPATAN